jgi:type II secretory pathway component GspD/PulD (secretin)
MGSVTVDMAAGHLIVRDVRTSVEEVGRLVAIENAILSRQVELQLRIIRVQYSDSTQNGASLSTAYNKLVDGKSEAAFGLTSPSSLAGADSGSLGFSILGPNSRWAGTQLLIQALNNLGKIVSDKTTSIITTNRHQVPITKFLTQSYLAKTDPGQGGITGGAGVPGLTPGTVTTGFFLNALPTVYENNSVSLFLSLDQSDLLSLNSISTGTGATLQQIQIPTVSGDKSDHNVGLHEGESLVLMSLSGDAMNSSNRYGITGASQSNSATKDMQVIIVTPKVLQGI